jgi:hypothetical protein
MNHMEQCEAVAAILAKMDAIIERLDTVISELQENTQSVDRVARNTF